MGKETMGCIVLAGWDKEKNKTKQGRESYQSKAGRVSTHILRLCLHSELKRFLKYQMIILSSTASNQYWSEALDLREGTSSSKT